MARAKRPFPHLDFHVMGKLWKAYFTDTRYFNKTYGVDTLAATETDEKKVFFRAKKLPSEETIIHELVHAYLWETGLRSMDLDVDQLEELFCELCSKHMRVLLATADLIKAHLHSSAL